MYLCHTQHFWVKGSERYLPHLVHMDVVEVVPVVDGLEHALQLPGSTAVHHQHEGNAHGVIWKELHRVLVPLHILVGFAWGKAQGKRQQFFVGGIL